MYTTNLLLSKLLLLLNLLLLKLPLQLNLLLLNYLLSHQLLLKLLLEVECLKLFQPMDLE